MSWAQLLAWVNADERYAAELKRCCASLDLTTEGNTRDLRERLQRHIAMERDPWAALPSAAVPAGWQPGVNAPSRLGSWVGLLAYVNDEACGRNELRRLCRAIGLSDSGRPDQIRDRIRRRLAMEKDPLAAAPASLFPANWHGTTAAESAIDSGAVPASKPDISRYVAPNDTKPSGRRILPAIAFDRDVLKLVAPAYALPFVDLAAVAIGLPALAPWFWLLGPAVGLHALLTLNVASRSKGAQQEEAPLLTTPGLDRLSADLEAGFSRLGADDGSKAVEELANEYVQLQPVLARRRITDSLSVAQIPALAEETYRQGLSVLQDALDLMTASSAAEKARLESENASIAREIEAMSSDPAQAGRLKIRQDRLASNKELLEIMNKQQERVDDSLYQSDRCGASLQRTRMELAGMRADGSEDGVNAVIDTLRLTINHAKGVQDEMKRLTTRSPRMT